MKLSIKHLQVVINLTKNVTFNLPEFSKFVALKLLKCYRLTSLSVERTKIDMYVTAMVSPTFSKRVSTHVKRNLFIYRNNCKTRFNPLENTVWCKVKNSSRKNSRL